MSKQQNYKMLCGPRQRISVPRVVPINKVHEEIFISDQLRNALIEDFKIENITHNEDDSNKGADTYCDWEGTKKGIQITRLTIENSIMTQRVSQQLSIKFLENVFYRVKPIEKLIINIFSKFDDENTILKLKSKKVVKFCDYLVKQITNHEMTHDKNKFEYFLYPYRIPVPNFLEDDIKEINFQYPPDNQIVYVPGRDNLFINFNFDLRTIRENTLEEEIDLIYEKKNSGKAEVLIIWCDIFEVLYQQNEIAKLLTEKFKDSTFEYVYLMTFKDNLEMFEKTFKLFKIKE